MQTATEIKAVVIDRDGTYGTHATVWFSGSLAACQRYARRGNCQVLTGCEKQKGDKIPAGPLANMLAAGLWKRA